MDTRMYPQHEIQKLKVPTHISGRTIKTAGLPKLTPISQPPRPHSSYPKLQTADVKAGATKVYYGMTVPILSKMHKHIEYIG